MPRNRVRRPVRRPEYKYAQPYINISSRSYLFALHGFSVKVSVGPLTDYFSKMQQRQHDKWKQNISFGLQTVTKLNFPGQEFIEKIKHFWPQFFPLAIMRHFRFSVSPSIAPYNKQDLNHSWCSKRSHVVNIICQAKNYFLFFLYKLFSWQFHRLPHKAIRLHEIETTFWLGY